MHIVTCQSRLFYAEWYHCRCIFNKKKHPNDIFDNKNWRVSSLFVRYHHCYYYHRGYCGHYLLVYFINTLRPRQNGRNFPDNIPKYIFVNENMWISINISLNFVPKGGSHNIPFSEPWVPTAVLLIRLFWERYSVTHIFHTYITDSCIELLDTNCQEYWWLQWNLHREIFYRDFANSLNENMQYIQRIMLTLRLWLCLVVVWYCSVYPYLSGWVTWLAVMQ